MKYRTLGRTGYQVSEIGLGCWQFGGDFGPMDERQTAAILDEARERGVTFWDTADVYGAGQSETRIGRWMQRAAAAGSGENRPVVATKIGRNRSVFPDRYSKELLREGLEGSCRRLGVETLDLVQLHCVPQQVLQAGEVFGWMDQFQQDGLVQHYGASVETIEEAAVCLDNPNLASLQIIFNLFRQDAAGQLLEKAQQADVGVIVRLPLASGLLSGQWTRDKKFAEQDHRNFNRDGERFNVGETLSGLTLEKGVELADQLKQFVPAGMSMGQFALRWILDHPAVSTAIAGTTRVEQVAENAAASDCQPLGDELHRQLRDFYFNHVREHVRGAI